MVELINENFLEVIGNKLVIEYFNQQNKLNQSWVKLKERTKIVADLVEFLSLIIMVAI